MEEKNDAGNIERTGDRPAEGAAERREQHLSSFAARQQGGEEVPNHLVGQIRVRNAGQGGSSASTCPVDLWLARILSCGWYEYAARLIRASGEKKRNISIVEPSGVYKIPNKRHFRTSGIRYLARWRNAVTRVRAIERSIFSARSTSAGGSELSSRRHPRSRPQTSALNEASWERVCRRLGGGSTCWLRCVLRQKAPTDRQRCEERKPFPCERVRGGNWQLAAGHCRVQTPSDRSA